MWYPGTRRIRFVSINLDILHMWLRKLRCSWEAWTIVVEYQRAELVRSPSLQSLHLDGTAIVLLIRIRMPFRCRSGRIGGMWNRLLLLLQLLLLALVFPPLAHNVGENEAIYDQHGQDNYRRPDHIHRYIQIICTGIGHSYAVIAPPWFLCNLFAITARLPAIS